MKTLKHLLGLLTAALPLTLTLWTPTLMATEEPVFDLVSKQQGFELRRYAPYLVAEVTVSGDFDDVGSEAFKILAGYIFGSNQPATRIAMTAPVSQRPASNSGKKIAMTAPVIQTPAKGSGAYTISFVMPAEFTLATLPQPLDKRIQMREQAARLMAVRAYSGFWSYSNYRENLDTLIESIKAADLMPLSAPIYARYNPPFTPWFLRRNEVLVEVASAPASLPVSGP